MSETEKADIVERLRKNAEQMYVNELRSDAADAGIYRSWKNTATEAAAEIERLRALPSRSDVLEEAARVADEAAKRASDADSENARELGDAYDANCYGAGYDCGACEYSAEIAAAIRALKKDTDNG